MKKQSYFEMSRIGAEYDEDERFVLSPEEISDGAGVSIGRSANESREKEPENDLETVFGAKEPEEELQME